VEALSVTETGLNSVYEGCTCPTADLTMPLIINAIFENYFTQSVVKFYNI